MDMASSASGRCRAALTLPNFGPDGDSVFLNRIYPLRADSVGPAAIGREFCELRDLFGSPSQFGFRPGSEKCPSIPDAGWGSETVPRLRPSAKRNAIRAVGDPIRSAASGMHPYEIPAF